MALKVSVDRSYSKRSPWFKGFFLLYKDKYVLSMVFLGFCSGLPFLLTLSTLNLWFVESGISKVTVGLLGILHLPYSLKFMCAPLMDVLRVPVLHRWLGHRRSWAVTSQIALVLLLLGLGRCDPQHDLVLMLFLAFFVSCAKACQDVVLYACQVEMLKSEQYTAGASCMIAGYRMGMLISGAGTVYLAALMSWQAAYGVMACLVGLGIFYVWQIPEPATSRGSLNPLKYLEDIGFQPKASLVRQTLQAFMIPFRLIKKYPEWVMIASFILWFKVGDTLSHFMANPYYLELGYTKTEIGTVVKTFGMGASLLGGLMAPFFERLWGMRRAFVGAGCIHMLSILLMIVMGWVGHHLPTFYTCIAIENGTNGVAMSLFIAYLYRLSPSPYSSILYPFWWAIHSVSRDVCNAFSGWLADALGWYPFFFLCALISIPSLGIFWKVTRAMEKEPSHEASHPSDGV